MKKVRRKQTTEEEKSKFVDCFHEGLSVKKTGELLNRSKTTVLNHWKSMGLKRERRPKDKVDFILNNSEKKYDELARDTGFCESTVRTILQENGLVPKLPKMKTKEERDTRNEEMLQDFRELGSLSEVAKKHGISHSLVSQNISQEDKELYSHVKQITDEIVDYSIENYSLETSGSIAEKFGVSRSSILKIWMEVELSGKDIGRQYYCKFDIFEEIDTSEKAYILGFIMADGCLFQREGHQGSLHITIHKQDVDVLEFINQVLESDYPINQHEEDYVSLVIVSDKLVGDLMNLGVTPRKTWGQSIKINMIPTEYQRDFVFGFFDGDGSIGKVKTAHSTTGVDFYGNLNNMEQMQKILTEIGIPSKIRQEDKERYSRDFYRLSLTGMTEKYAFLKLYLQKPYIAMKRKAIRANRFIYQVENNTTNRSENTKAVQNYKSFVLSLVELVS